MGNRKKTEEVGIRGLQSISDLEVEIMNIVWEKKLITVREVHEILLKKEVARKDKGFIPYTTVMSTMSNLAVRGFLIQNNNAKTYIYSAALDNKELTKNIIKTVAEKLLD
jgi:predicted transcriptional regulator